MALKIIFVSIEVNTRWSHWSRIDIGAQTAQAAGQVHCGILGFAYSQIPSQPCVPQVASSPFTTMITSVSLSTFLCLESAMVSPLGSMVDVVAVVAYIGPTDTRLLHQYGMRKLCLKDTRLILCLLHLIL